MKVNNVLIERGKLGKDRSIINIKGINIPKEKVPVFLNNDIKSEPIGQALVTMKGDVLFADIEIPNKKDLLMLFPNIAIGVKNPDDYHKKGSIKVVDVSRLIGVCLSPSPNCDPKIPSLNKKSIV